MCTCGFPEVEENGHALPYGHYHVPWFNIDARRFAKDGTCFATFINDLDKDMESPTECTNMQAYSVCVELQEHLHVLAPFMVMTNTRVVEKGEELSLFYGHEYWKGSREHSVKRVESAKRKKRKRE